MPVIYSQSAQPSHAKYGPAMHPVPLSECTESNFSYTSRVSSASVQIALQATVTRTERMPRSMQLTERTSTARQRTPCWTPWRLPRRSMMPRSSQVLYYPMLLEALQATIHFTRKEA